MISFPCTPRFHFAPHHTLAAIALLPVLLMGCGGGGSNQPTPKATPTPTTTSTPIPTTTPETTIAGVSNFALTIVRSQTSNYTATAIQGVGTSQIGQSLRTVSVLRSETVGSFTLSLNRNRALVQGDIVTIGIGASGDASRLVAGTTTGQFPIGYWKAASGQVRIASVNGQSLTLRADNVVFTPTNSFAKGTFTCNGTIAVVPQTTR